MSRQCEELGIELRDIELDYEGRPEPALLRHFEAQGYVGASIEGYAILSILKALMLDKLAELNTFNDRQDACSRYLEAQFTILERRIQEIIQSIPNTSRRKFVRNLKEIISQPFVRQQHPGITKQFGKAIFDAIDTRVFMELAEKFSEDPYTYRSGWPDLTLVQKDEVRFIEVKTTDKLHASQLTTIPAMMSVLPYTFEVYRVMRP